MRGVLLKGESLNKQGGSNWTGRGENYSAIVTALVKHSWKATVRKVYLIIVREEDHLEERMIG